jgi:mono/diheme cytochrome c family protein
MKLKQLTTKQKLALNLASSIILLGCMGWLITSPRPSPVKPDPARTVSLENGKRLFHAGGCASCHGDENQKNVSEPARLSGGHRLASPFGTFIAPNISPDPEHGIGKWSLENFINAMTAGISPSGEHYFPAFPYTSYRVMPASDLADMFGYIQTLPAIAAPSLPHEVPFPFNVRRAVGLWKTLYLGDIAPLPEAPKDASPLWIRGRYLVEGPGHCAECHSPRNLLGGIIPARRLAGGPSPDGKGYVPNITPHEDGLKNWSEDEIVEALTTGFTPSFDSLGGTMAPVVRNLAKLPADDRKSIAHYLKSLPPAAGKN